jgi:hypothetical protein
MVAWTAGAGAEPRGRRQPGETSVSVPRKRTRRQVLSGAGPPPADRPWAGRAQRRPAAGLASQPSGGAAAARMAAKVSEPARSRRDG